MKGCAKIVGFLLLPVVFYGFLAEASTENKNKKEIGKKFTRNTARSAMEKMGMEKPLSQMCCSLHQGTLKIH